ncbi:uncharacterized protein LOC125943654 [Dermacentor silvarum]|uniref:uncharacterized protein LOC125943654 n=1 Tax=Dermacentor silvarum TaxID=543639 RepID=UPI002100AB05|nr:uncharacterized protein LOC125943654 [Dermacentor silvarum]
MSPSTTLISFTLSGMSSRRHRRRHRRLDFVQHSEPFPDRLGADSARNPPSSKRLAPLFRPHKRFCRSRRTLHRKCQHDVMSGRSFGSAAAAAPGIPRRVTGDRSGARLAWVLRPGISKVPPYFGPWNKWLRYYKGTQPRKWPELSTPCTVGEAAVAARCE